MIKVTEIIEVKRNGERKKLDEFTSLFKTEDEAVDYIFECCKPSLNEALGAMYDDEVVYSVLKGKVRQCVKTGTPVVLEGYVQCRFVIERKCE